MFVSFHNYLLVASEQEERITSQTTRPLPWVRMILGLLILCFTAVGMDCLSQVASFRAKQNKTHYKQLDLKSTEAVEVLRNGKDLSVSVSVDIGL